MTNSISFIHAADLHLDSPYKGLTHIPKTIFQDIRESTFKALDNLVSTAIKKQVDFVLLAGDLFDNENQSLKAQVYLREAFERLESHHIHVYLSYGNHDFINGNIHPIDYPENVHIFLNENVTSFTYEKDKKKLASIYGFSYENRSLTKNMSIEFNVKDTSIPFHIAMMHGTVNGNKEHDPYAPFNLSDLQAKDFDYWALGHIHKREQLSEFPSIIYPGNIQGRHRNEAGEKGCYYVRLSSAKTDLEFIPLHSVLFQETRIDISNCDTIYQMEEKLRETFQNNSCKQLIHLTLYSKTNEILNFETDGMIKELIDVINETMIIEKPWSYIYAYRIDTDNLSHFNYDDFFIGEIIQSLDNLSVSETITDLYKHPVARKFLENLSTEDIQEAAKQFLIHELLKVKEGD
ncbi:DNA repair exonuclease [Pseudogracilibacillus sp. SE30717A]|uniref:metallophosphoesterase family protein n=1 Tax=Pseudogracilibacillus sp. SE30717A TaxID=3098293 RepID=UPI00300E0F54